LTWTVRHLFEEMFCLYIEGLRSQKLTYHNNSLTVTDYLELFKRLLLIPILSTPLIFHKLRG
jgi:hypothetical protein